MHTLWKNSCSFSTEIEHTERNELALLSANLSPSLMINTIMDRYGFERQTRHPSATIKMDREVLC